MKKIISILLVSVMALTFVGCSNSSNEKDTTTTETSSAVSETTHINGADADVTVADVSTAKDENCETTDDGFTYVVSGKTATITGFTGSEKNIVIPDKVNGVVVTKIGDGAFLNSDITSVAIGNTVKEIQSYAFESCAKLKSVKLGNKLEKIQGLAFWDCLLIESITIPKSVTFIGRSAFFECVKLQKVKVLNPQCKIEEYAFGYYNMSKIGLVGGMTIYGEKLSTAKDYANDNDITFKTL